MKRHVVAAFVSAVMLTLVGAGCGSSNDSGNGGGGGAKAGGGGSGGGGGVVGGGGGSHDMATGGGGGTAPGPDMTVVPDMTLPPDMTDLTGTTYTLTTGADTFTGGPLQDTFLGTVAGAFGSMDVLNGGDGIDTLDVTDSSGIGPGAVMVSNIEIAKLTTTATMVVNTTSWVGLLNVIAQSSGNTALTLGAGTDLAAHSLLGGGEYDIDGAKNVTLTATNSGSGAINVGGTTAPVGTVAVSNTSTGAVTMGDITVNGGTTVNVTQAAGNAVGTTTTMGNVIINGTAGTTAVTVNNAASAAASGTVAGIIDNSVSVEDFNAESATVTGTIASVTASNYTTIGISDNALANLSLTGGSGNMIIDNSGQNTPAVTTLHLTLDGNTGGTLDDADVYTTLDIMTVNRPSTMANITFGGMTALNLSGTQRLTIYSTAGSTALHTVTVTGSAGLSANLASLGTVTSVDASGTSGDMRVTLAPNQATYKGGSGADNVTLSNTTITKAIDVGTGNDTVTLNLGTGVPTATITGGMGTDILSMDGGDAVSNSAGSAFAGKVTGFETLQITGATNQTFDMSALGPFTTLRTGGGNGLSVSGFVTGDTLALTGPGTAYTVSGTLFGAGTADVLNVALISTSGAPTSFATSGITATGVEQFNIVTMDNAPTATGLFLDEVGINGNDVKVVNLSGNAGATLDATSTALTSVDASGITLGGFGWVDAGAITAANLVVKGSAAGVNQVDLSNVTGALTYTGGTGADYVTIAASTAAKTLNVGGGGDVVTLKAPPASATALTSIGGLATGGKIDLSATRGTVTLSAQTSLGAAKTAGGTLAASLDVAAAGDGSGSTVLSWFQFGGNTYIVHDRSAATTFQAGADTVVELLGLVDLSTATVVSGVITR